MKMKKKLFALASLLMVASLILSGCGTSAKKPTAEAGGGGEIAVIVKTTECAERGYGCRA
jgi:uncharacterized protein YceK